MNQKAMGLRIGFLTTALVSLLVTSQVAAQMDPMPFDPLPGTVRAMDRSFGAHLQQKLDVFSPAAGGPYPAVVFIHGGGWDASTKLRFHPYAAYFASQRYVGVSTDYRLSSVAPYPAALHDIKAAVRHLRAHAAEYRIDPNRIALCGHSAGGHLAALTAATNGEATMEGKGQNPEQSSEVQLAVGLAGIYDLRLHWSALRPDYLKKFMGGKEPHQAPEAYREASPIMWVRPHTPPMLFMHGSADLEVLAEQSTVMSEALNAIGRDARAYLAIGKEHRNYYFFNKDDFKQTALYIENWLSQRFRGESELDLVAPK